MSMKNLEIDEITGRVVDAAYKLHMRLGPGLLEKEGLHRVVNNYRPSPSAPPRLCVNQSLEIPR